MLLQFIITYTLFGWNFDILSTRFPSAINFHLNVQILKEAAKLSETSMRYFSLSYNLFNLLRLTSPYESCAIFVYSLLVSPYLLAPPGSGQSQFAALNNWTSSTLECLSLPIYHNMVNSIVFFIRRCPNIFMNVTKLVHCSLDWDL
jgi:hypothetical protein